MTTTPRLGMTLVEPTDHGVGTSIADGLMQKVNDALDRIDDQIGAVVCTSGTRPSSPYGGQPIYETDTRLLQIRNAANSAWQQVNTGIPIFANTAAVSSPFTNMIIFDTSFLGLKKYNGSTWDIYTPNGKAVYKASTISRSSTTTMGNDPDFVFPVLANAAYKVESYIVYDGVADGATAGGVKFGFTGPSLASMYFSNFGVNGQAGGGTLTDYNVVVEGLASGAPRNVGTNTSGFPMSCHLTGVLVVNANAGSLTMQWAQKFSSATAARIMAASWMEVTRIF